MALESMEQFARAGVPQFQFTGLSGPATTGGDALAVGAEGHAVDLSGVSLKSEEALPGGRVPHLHLTGDRAYRLGRDQPPAIGAEGHGCHQPSVPAKGPD